MQYKHEFYFIFIFYTTVSIIPTKTIPISTYCFKDNSSKYRASKNVHSPSNKHFQNIHVNAINKQAMLSKWLIQSQKRYKTNFEKRENICYFPIV